MVMTRSWGSQGVDRKDKLEIPMVHMSSGVTQQVARVNNSTLRTEPSW